MSSDKEWLQGDTLERCPECDQRFNPAYTNGWCPYFDCGEYQAPTYQPDASDSSECPTCGNDIQSHYQFCPSCGEQLAPDSSTPDLSDLLADGKVHLDIEGQKLTLSPNETLGENIRVVLRSQGKPARIYRQIHSEHARVFESNSTLLLRKEGTNAITLNGRELKQGEVRPIADGDTIGLSGVVEAEISLV